MYDKQARQLCRGRDQQVFPESWVNTLPPSPGELPLMCVQSVCGGDVVLLVHDDHEVLLFTLLFVLFLHFPIVFQVEVLQCFLAFPLIHPSSFLQKKHTVWRMSGKSRCVTDYLSVHTWSWTVRPGRCQVSLGRFTSRLSPSASTGSRCSRILLPL